MKFFSQLLTRASYDPQPAIDFQVAFNKAGPAVKTNIKHLGKLHVPTGSIVICDGIVINDAKPLSQKIPAGDYDVSVLISEQGSKDAPNERYALAKLTVSNNPAVKWQLATTDGQNIHKLKPGEYFGYAIDAGVGCFMDEQTYREYDEFSEEICKKNPNANFYDDYLADLFKKNAKNPNNPQSYGDWVNFVIPGSGKDNVIIFNSGWGDGVYPSYWGYDAEEKVCCLVTDFLVLSLQSMER